jgi:hypothetical protein
MSLVRACLRLVTVAALRDRTWAETRVYNSDNTPLEEAVAQAEAPYIVVYTDDDARHDVEGLDLTGSNRFIALTIAFGVAGPVQAVEGGSTIAFPQTDAGYEMVLDMVERQIINALVHDPSSTWGALWKDLATNFGAEVRSRRGGSSEGGVRWAARELSLQVATIADRPPGVPYADDHPVKRFITAARGAPDDSGLGPAANIIEAAINPDLPAPAWRQAQAWLGLTDTAVRGLGLAPPYDTPDAEVPIASLDGIDGAGADGMLNRVEFEEATAAHEMAELAEDAANAPENPVP